jgi:hypothetical protein
MRRTMGIVAAAIAVVGLVCLLLPGCDDDPTGPRSQAENYSFYFFNATDSIYYEYVPEVGVVDSFSLPYRFQGYFVSADNRRLYVYTDDGTVVIDRATLRVLDELPSRVLAESPNGRLLAFVDTALHIVLRRDHSPVFEDTAAFMHKGMFSPDGRVFYGHDYGKVYRVRLDSLPQALPTIHPISGGIQTLAPLMDDRKWVIMSFGRSCWSRFTVLEPATGTTNYGVLVDPGHGDMAVGAGGKYAFATNPGDVISYECDHPEYSVRVFDIEANQFIGELSTINRYGADSTLDSVVGINEFAASPDGRWILGTAWRNRFVLIDAVNLEIVRFESFGPDLFVPTIQSAKAQAGY